MEEIAAWEHATALLPHPATELLALGYAELAAHRPQRALQEFDRAAASLPPSLDPGGHQYFFARLRNGQSMALSALAQQR